MFLTSHDSEGYKLHGTCNCLYLHRLICQEKLFLNIVKYYSLKMRDIRCIYLFLVLFEDDFFGQG